jgi:hypothetical protein
VWGEPETVLGGRRYAKGVLCELCGDRVKDSLRARFEEPFADEQLQADHG